MRDRDLARELDSAIANVDDAVKLRLERLGVSSELLRLPLSMVGVIRARPAGPRLFEPSSAGVAMFITPVFIGDPWSAQTSDPVTTARCGGDLIDLVAWRPDGGWALRTGNAAWIGAIEPQYLDPGPVRVFRSVLGWLQGELDGIALLTDDPLEVYRTLCDCRGGIIAEDQAHAAELRGLLARPWPAPRVIVAPITETHHAA